MKKLFKKVTSAFLALAIAVTFLPIATVNVEATSRTVNDAVSWIKARANEGWNVDVDGAYGCQCVDLIYAYYLFLGYPIQGGNGCNYAQGSFGIPTGSGWYKDTTPSPGAIIAWDENVSTGGVVRSDGSVYQSRTYAGGHVGLVYAVEGSTVYTVETNLSAPYNGGPAQYRIRYPQNAIYIHPDFPGTTPSSPIEYETIQPSTYFIVSKSDGKSLTLGNNEDWNTNNIHMYETTWTNRGQYMVVTEAPDGYKIRPIDSTRLVNPYGDYAASGENINIYADVNDNSQWWKFQKVDGGYVIRNTQNPNLVIDNSQSDNAVLWEYNGEANQIWELIPVTAPGKPVITNVKSSYETSESVVVKWDSTSDTNQYNIAVEKKTNGEYKEIYWKDNVSSGYTLNSVMTLDSGDYRVRVASVNNKVLNGDYYLSTIGDYVNFTVKEKAQTYTVTFNANGGSGTMSSVTMTYGVAQNLPANTFTRSGYTFLGWSKDKNATTATYTDKQSVKNLASSGTVTLYAIWKKNTTSNENNGAFRVEDVTAAVGQTVQIPIYIDDVELSGLVFTVNFDPNVLKYVSAADMAFEAADYNTSNISKGSLSISCVNTAKVVGGKVVTLNFKVIASSACTTKVSVSASDAIDAQDKEVALKNSEATISVTSTIKGDVNNDGKVTVADAKWVLQASSGSRTLTAEQITAADVNGDGKVTIADAKWLLQVASGSRKL